MRLTSLLKIGCVVVVIVALSFSSIRKGAQLAKGSVNGVHDRNAVDAHLSNPGQSDFSERPEGLRSGAGAVDAAETHDFVLCASIFGNFRNETAGLDRTLSQFSTFDVDRFLFTDSNPSEIGPVPGWTVVRIPTGEGANGIPASRLRVKEIKWRGHDLIRKYRYRIHVDTKTKATDCLREALENGLLDKVRSTPSKALYIQKHAQRETIEQEVKAMRGRIKIQPKAPLRNWDSHLRSMYGNLSHVRLVDTLMFVLDTHHRDFARKFASVYDTLIEWGLWRDQIVYPYATADVQDRVEHITCEMMGIHFGVLNRRAKGFNRTRTTRVNLTTANDTVPSRT
ncbi:hypothetical protein ACHAWF_007623 [Thalassiosira exigua]